VLAIQDRGDPGGELVGLAFDLIGRVTNLTQALTSTIFVLH